MKKDSKVKKKTGCFVFGGRRYCQLTTIITDVYLFICT